MSFRGFLIFVLLSSNCVFAEERVKSNLATNQISGDVQLMTQYVERGIGMSDQNPAMNASFLYNLGSQVRMGFWGSNISNLSASDDNLWLKFLVEFNVLFGTNLKTKFYASDNHFYKSDQRNGQRFGAEFNYYSAFYTLEWMSNFEGSKANAEYIEAGKLFYSGNKIRYGLAVGYTVGHATTTNSYFNIKALAQYVLNTTTYFEADATVNSDPGAFGKRGDPAVYASVNLSY
jgi:hypothetical protein